MNEVNETQYVLFLDDIFHYEGSYDSCQEMALSALEDGLATISEVALKGLYVSRRVPPQ